VHGPYCLGVQSVGSLRYGASRQVVEQRFGVLQDRRVEALGEPTVDGREKITGFGGLALIARGGQDRRPLAATRIWRFAAEPPPVCL
jgi:hypothetical protein